MAQSPQGHRPGLDELREPLLEQALLRVVEGQRERVPQRGSRLGRLTQPREQLGAGGGQQRVARQHEPVECREPGRRAVALRDGDSAVEPNAGEGSRAASTSYQLTTADHSVACQVGARQWQAAIAAWTT